MDKRVFQVVGSPKGSVMNADGIYKFCPTGTGILEWRIGGGDPYGNFLRLTEDRGWLLSWYDNPSKNTDCPPSKGWRFNGGNSKPRNLGSNIRILEISTKKLESLHNRQIIVPTIKGEVNLVDKISPPTPKAGVGCSGCNKFISFRRMGNKLLRRNSPSMNISK